MIESGKNNVLFISTYMLLMVFPVAFSGPQRSSHYTQTLTMVTLPIV